MNSCSDRFDIIVLGAGGAGLMCAGVAAKKGKRVLVLDHADKPGKKILISGGGRCNFTNIHTSAENFISSNPHFAKSALKRYQPTDFIELAENYNIGWHEKTLGQLFCDNSAKNIVSMLLMECEKSHVSLEYGHQISGVEYSDGRFSIWFGGKLYSAESLVIATGGPSIPKIGATGFAYDLARQFRLKVVEPRPALVPLTLGPDEALFRELSGVSAEVIASNDKASFREAALFTHKGLSGPAILQISSYWRHGESLDVNFIPDLRSEWLVEEKRRAPKQHLKNIISNVLPLSLAETLIAKFGIAGEVANISDKALREICLKLAGWTFSPNGTEGFAKAEVTLGGVSTDELSSKTMEAKRVPGLYFIGECVDVTGWLGGYNFQWAWASGTAAGIALQ